MCHPFFFSTALELSIVLIQKTASFVFLVFLSSGDFSAMAFKRSFMVLNRSTTRVGLWAEHRSFDGNKAVFTDSDRRLNVEEGVIQAKSA